MRKINYFLSSCVLFIWVGLTINVNAQTTSNIEGTITDANGAVIAGATVKANGTTLGAERTATTDADGFYRLVALPAGSYTLTFSQNGFATSTSNIELTLNRTAEFNIQLQVKGVSGNVVNVTTDVPLVDQNRSSTGTTITPRQIQDLPVNGRNYLDLLQLVPGTAINRQADPNGDRATPILGERSGNNNFLIDGQSNKDTVNGGPAAQFNQETIAEFQVLTTGFKAEFGQASGGVVNVITKSGGNEYHGVASLFHRNEAFDSSNALTANKDVPHLRRFDYSVAFGGPLINPGFGEGTEFFKPLKDKVFFFGSAERITENRRLDFEYPNLGTSAGAQTVLGILKNREQPFDLPNISRESRVFFKLNEQLGRHSLNQEINYTNGLVRDFLPFGSTGLPSSRNSTGERHLLLGFGDTVLLGDQGNPYILTVRAAYRGEPSSRRASHPEGGPSTTFNGYTTQNCAGCIIFGNLPTVGFGNGATPSNLDQKYTILSANLNKLFGNHDVKFGYNFMRTQVDGVVARNLVSQVFTTIDDFLQFGPINSGISLLAQTGALTPAGDRLHLRNNYNALYGQDDWKLRKNLTLNLGLRYDYDSAFEAKKNFSPRLGVAYAINPKTIVRANFGIFYDQFRLGLVSNVPAFGGVDRRGGQDLLFPRGLYGSPSFVSSIAFLSGLPGGCFSNNLTDAQITAAGLKCPLSPKAPFIGVDRLNNVVAPGHAPIPANAVINLSNIQQLTGLSPDQYLAQAAAAIGQPVGYFTFGAYGILSNPVLPPAQQPITVDGTFKTPNTLGFSVGFKRELTNNLAVEVDYHHKDIRDTLGTRRSNIAYGTRVAGFGIKYTTPGINTAINTFGPFYEGKYDGLVVSVNKRLSNRYLFGASYTYSHARDNSLGINTIASDSFIGIVPQVTEAATGKTNANGSFISTNGNFVAKAGTFSNGPDLDKGPSDLALDHIFEFNGLVNLPYQIQVSGIFRAQSGFHFSQTPNGLIDPDGDSFTNGVDVIAGRNKFTAPPFVNLDMRFAKALRIGERVRAQILFEFFNILNRQNPGSVYTQDPVVAVNPFGSIRQVLPGREGQIGFRIEF